MNHIQKLDMVMKLLGEVSDDPLAAEVRDRLLEADRIVTECRNELHEELRS